jgi:phospholipid/cholesterol/gamma-HCH transport system substrate-binding protein
MQRKSLDVWVGLFIVVGVAALMFLALKAGNMGTMSFGKTYPITAKFDNIGGLRRKRRSRPPAWW